MSSTVPAPPRWTLSPSQLDGLELHAAGLSDGPRLGAADARDPLRPELVVDTDTAAAATRVGTLVLTDAEGTPLATARPTTTTRLDEGRVRIHGQLSVQARPARADPIAARRELPARLQARSSDGRARLGHRTDRSLHAPDLAALAAAARAHAPDAPRLLVVLAVTGDDRRHAVHTAVQRALEAVPTDVAVELDVVQLPPVTDALRAQRDRSLLARLGATASTTPPTAPPAPDTDTAVGHDALPTHHLDADAVAEGEALATRIRSGDALGPSELQAALPEVVAALRPAYPLRHDRGAVVLFTGLSGAGKSTIARAVRDHLLARTGRPVTLLDGDLVRRHLSSGLGFSREDRDRNVMRIGFVAAEIARHGGLALCAPIAPFDAVRRQVRAMVECTGAGFRLVHVATPLEVCEARDTKGLYARARAGQLRGMTGVDDPYEPPTDAEVVLDTADMALDDAVRSVVDSVADGGWWSDPAVLRAGSSRGAGHRGQ